MQPKIKTARSENLFSRDTSFDLPADFLLYFYFIWDFVFKPRCSVSLSQWNVQHQLTGRALTGIRAELGRSAPPCGVLAEIIASVVSLLVTFNYAIDGVIQNNLKARANPKALAQLDGYKRPLVGSLSANLQRFGYERVAKVETLQKIIDQMSDDRSNQSE